MNRKRPREMVGRAFLILGLATVAALPSGSQTNLLRVRREMLCVTEGAVQEMPGERLSVNSPKMRAYVNRSALQNIAADFTYLGPTAVETKLGSGETRRQFGLKLRAEDACNVVYAMWRIAAQSKLVVSVKSNPGQHTSAECGNRGYRNVKPLRDSPLPPLHSGDRHLFRAEMKGVELRVFLDDAVVWDGKVGTEGLDFNGPVGIRSDNARLEMELQAGLDSSSHPDYVAVCKSGPESE